MAEMCHHIDDDNIDAFGVFFNQAASSASGFSKGRRALRISDSLSR
jgi:hypothetical protein